MVLYKVVAFSHFDFIFISYALKPLFPLFFMLRIAINIDFLRRCSHLINMEEKKNLNLTLNKYIKLKLKCKM